ncbi:zinc finger domain-containing protein [Streptomyces scabiei]
MPVRAATRSRAPANSPSTLRSCPRCQAAPGVRCTSPRGRRLAIDSHDARLAAHQAQTARQTGAAG